MGRSELMRGECFVMHAGFVGWCLNGRSHCFNAPTLLLKDGGGERTAPPHEGQAPVVSLKSLCLARVMLSLAVTACLP